MPNVSGSSAAVSASAITCRYCWGAAHNGPNPRRCSRGHTVPGPLPRSLPLSCHHPRLTLPCRCLKFPAPAAACPAVAGYTFYRLQDAAGSVTLATLDAAAATSVSAIADVCASTPRCNAFTAAGQLRIVPTRPVFTALDASASDTQECDGIYVSARSLSGLILPVSLLYLSIGSLPTTFLVRP